MNIKKETAILNIEYQNLKKKLDEIAIKKLKLAFKVDLGIEKITLFGTTPSFNDGDECLHYQESYFKINGNPFNLDDYDELEADEDAPSFSLDQEKVNQLAELLNSESVQNFLEQSEGTNWEITITLKDNEVLIDKKHRDHDY